MTDPTDIYEFLRERGYDTLDEFIKEALEAQRDYNEPRLYQDVPQRLRELRRNRERDRGRKRRRVDGALPRAAHMMMSAKYAYEVQRLTAAGVSAAKIAELLKLSRTHVYRLRKSGACDRLHFSDKDRAIIELLADDLGMIGDTE